MPRRRKTPYVPHPVNPMSIQDGGERQTLPRSPHPDSQDGQASPGNRDQSPDGTDCSRVRPPPHVTTHSRQQRHDAYDGSSSLHEVKQSTPEEIALLRAELASLRDEVRKLKREREELATRNKMLEQRDSHQVIQPPGGTTSIQTYSDQIYNWMGYYTNKNSCMCKTGCQQSDRRSPLPLMSHPESQDGSTGYGERGQSPFVDKRLRHYNDDEAEVRRTRLLQWLNHNRLAQPYASQPPVTLLPRGNQMSSTCANGSYNLEEEISNLKAQPTILQHKVTNFRRGSDELADRNPVPDHIYCNQTEVVTGIHHHHAYYMHHSMTRQTEMVGIWNT